jgi:plastocyanin
MGSRRCAVALVALLSLAACSTREPVVHKRPHAGTGTASAVAGAQQIVVRSGVDLRFHPATLVVHRGLVRIVLVNTARPGAGPPHDLQVTGLPGADVPLTSAGRSSSVTFMAPAPGTYSFVCSIHANQGQTGKLVVR